MLRRGRRDGDRGGAGSTAAGEDLDRLDVLRGSLSEIPARRDALESALHAGADAGDIDAMQAARGELASLEATEADLHAAVQRARESAHAHRDRAELLEGNAEDRRGSAHYWAGRAELSGHVLK